MATVHVLTLASPARGNGARAPTTFNCLIFQVNSEPHKLWHCMVSICGCLPRKNILAQFCHSLLHEFHNIFVCHPEIIFFSEFRAPSRTKSWRSTPLCSDISISLRDTFNFWIDAARDKRASRGEGVWRQCEFKVGGRSAEGCGCGERNIGVISSPLGEGSGEGAFLVLWSRNGIFWWILRCYIHLKFFSLSWAPSVGFGSILWH